MDILDDFPGLRQTRWAVTSPETPEYNCIAWAAGDDTLWWWPDAGRDYYWPPGAPREETVEAFVAAFALLGYELCEAGDAALALQHEKVAIYTKDGKPTHAARQLQTGEWTSKCGRGEDITHTLEGLQGSWYGAPAVVMWRRRRDLEHIDRIIANGKRPPWPDMSQALAGLQRWVDEENDEEVCRALSELTAAELQVAQWK